LGAFLLLLFGSSGLVHDAQWIGLTEFPPQREISHHNPGEKGFSQWIVSCFSLFHHYNTNRYPVSPCHDMPRLTALSGIIPVCYNSRLQTKAGADATPSKAAETRPFSPAFDQII
jgi:hypothetical protein